MRTNAAQGLDRSPRGCHRACTMDLSNAVFDGTLDCVRLQHHGYGSGAGTADAMAGVDPESVPDELLGTLSPATLVSEIVRLRRLLHFAQESVTATHASSVAAHAEAKRLSDLAIVAELKDSLARGIPIPLDQLMFLRRSEAGLPATGPLEGECPICMSDLADEDSVYLFPECSHAMCTACAVGQVAEAVKSNCLQKLACQYEDCPTELPTADIKLLVEMADDATLWEKFHTFSVDSFLAANGNTVTCPKCNLQFIVEHQSPQIDCPGCSKQFCGHCPGTPDWHDGSTCEQFQTWKRENGQADDAFEALLKDAKSRIKPCPKCRAPVFKPLRTNGGACNYMSCRCGNHFCFLCGAGPLEASHQAHFEREGPCKGKLFWDDPASV